MKKRCIVVMLATDKSYGAIEYDHQDKRYSIEAKHYHHKNPKELYILSSDDEIKENDWCINRNLDTIYQIKAIVGNLENWIKIIATTDSSLKLYESETLAKASGFSLNTNDILLPSIPQSFIDKYVSEYNKGNKITDVMVKYEEQIESACICDTSEKLHKCIHYGGGENCMRRFDDGEFFHKWKTLKINPKDNTITINKIKDSWTKEKK